MLARFRHLPTRTPEEQRYRAAEIMRSYRRFLVGIKLTLGCIDCGYNGHPAALHFDHRTQAGKKFKLKGAGMRNVDDIVGEIMKCDVRCANCHSVSHAEDCNADRGYTTSG